MKGMIEVEEKEYLEALLDEACKQFNTGQKEVFKEYMKIIDYHNELKQKGDTLKYFYNHNYAQYEIIHIPKGTVWIDTEDYYGKEND